MRRVLRYLLITAAILVLLAVIHYSNEVFKAKEETPQIVRELLSSERMKISLEDFQDGWLDMLLRVEDPSFYTHNGMDLSTPGAGITTITQNLVKRLYFDNFKPGFAKLRVQPKITPRF